MRTAPGIGASSPGSDASSPDIILPETVTAARVYPSAPPAPATSSSIPPRFGSTAPLAQSSAPPPAAPTPRTLSGRPSLTPENPGPLLSTIVPKKKRGGGAFRVLVPILVGILAGVTTYVVAGEPLAPVMAARDARAAVLSRA